MTELLEETDRTAVVREEVRAWLAEHWNADIAVDSWRQVLADSGWGMPWWPVEYYGRGLPTELTRVVAEEFDNVRAPGPAPGMGTWLAGPTIVEHGTDTQKRHFLRRIITGEDRWCQLFSEPGSGSDLAGSQTTAQLSGDEWIVNGQKVWTSGAHLADLGMLVCRTDWDVPKHRGISYLIVDMRQPGVEVRPLRQMTGGAAFNEVFFTDARVPKDNVVGSVNDGWRVAMTTLMHERASLPIVGGRRGMTAQVRRGPDANGVTDEMANALRARAFPALLELARETGRTDDPVVRQELAAFYILDRTNRLNLQRAGANRKAGRPPGPEGSIAKLNSSAIARSSRELGMSLLRAGGLVAGREAPSGGLMQQNCLSSPSSSIAGGTDEIQLNILAERVLGLPKEPQVDRDVPFREVKRNLQRGSV